MMNDVLLLSLTVVSVRIFHVVLVTYYYRIYCLPPRPALPCLYCYALRPCGDA